MIINAIWQTATVKASSFEQVRVVALFKNKVVIVVDGKNRRTLNVQQVSPEGIRLIKASSDHAILEYGGREHLHRTSMGTTTGVFQKAAKKQANIPRGIDGMYKTIGSINRQPVPFLVDTGASIVAFSSVLADALNIEYQSGVQRQVQTASGLAKAYYITLQEVTVGDITMNNVEAAVIPTAPGQSSDTALLGMSFLSRVNLQDNGMMMVLEKKF